MEARLLALENIILTATSEGLGTYCVGSFNEKEVKAVVKVPENFEVLLLLAVGYTLEKLDLSSKLMRLVRTRKTLSDVASSEEFGQHIVPKNIIDL